jgi:hypothetical protein
MCVSVLAQLAAAAIAAAALFRGEPIPIDVTGVRALFTPSVLLLLGLGFVIVRIRSWSMKA